MSYKKVSWETSWPFFCAIKTINIGLETNVYCLTTGNHNVAVGNNASAITTGNHNVAVGYRAGRWQLMQLALAGITYTSPPVGSCGATAYDFNSVRHTARLAARWARTREGSSNAVTMPMMAMTSSNSIRVWPRSRTHPRS